MKINIKSLSIILCSTVGILIVFLFTHFYNINQKWVTYTNHTYDFSFDYPRGMAVACDDVDSETYAICNVERKSSEDPIFYQVVYVRRNPVDASSARDYVLSTYKGTVMGDPVTYNINNLEGVRAYLAGGIAEDLPKVIYFFHLDRGTILEIPYTGVGEDGQNWIDYEKFVSTIRRSY